MDDLFSPQFVTTILGYVFGGGVLWGAIRMDIKNIHTEIQEHKTSFKEHKAEVKNEFRETHRRIDSIIFGRRSSDKDS